jgi:hypothetical protein
MVVDNVKVLEEALVPIPFTEVITNDLLGGVVLALITNPGG